MYPLRPREESITGVDTITSLALLGETLACFDLHCIRSCLWQLRDTHPLHFRAGGNSGFVVSVETYHFHIRIMIVYSRIAENLVSCTTAFDATMWLKHT